MAYIPRVGILIGHHAFDLSILCSRREVNHLFLLILTILFCPGVGILIIFFRKCQNPHAMPDPPPPSGLTLIGALVHVNDFSSKFRHNEYSVKLKCSWLMNSQHLLIPDLHVTYLSLIISMAKFGSRYRLPTIYSNLPNASSNYRKP